MTELVATPIGAMISPERERFEEYIESLKEDDDEPSEFEVIELD